MCQPVRYAPVCYAPCPPPPSVVLPSSFSYSATLTLSKDINPEFLFPGYVNAQKFNSSNTYSFSTQDFKVERSLEGNQFVYKIQSSTAFQIRFDGNIHRVNTPGHSIVSPSGLGVTTIPFNKSAWDSFASKAAELQKAVASDGNADLAKKLETQMRVLRAIAEKGVHEGSLEDFILARDNLNQSLALAALRVKVSNVSDSSWNLQSKSFTFRLPAGDGGEIPQPKFTLTGSSNEELSDFTKPKYPDSENRLWAIAKDNAVLISRKRLDDGSYQFQVFLSKNFNGSIQIDPLGPGGNATTIHSAPNRGMEARVVSTYQPALVTPFSASAYGEYRPLVCVPENLVDLLPPLENQEWQDFRKEVSSLQARLRSEGKSTSADSIGRQFRLVELLTFSIIGSDPGYLEVARANLERLLAQTKQPGTSELIFTGTYQRVYTNCGWQLSPIYHRRETPGYTPPSIPKSPPPQLLPPLPANTAPLGPEFLHLENIHKRTPAIRAESYTHHGTFRHKGGASDSRFFLTSKETEQGVPFILEFESPDRRIVRYELGTKGEILKSPTIRPLGKEYPEGATPFIPPSTTGPANSRHRDYIAPVINQILLSLPPERPAPPLLKDPGPLTKPVTLPTPVVPTRTDTVFIPTSTLQMIRTFFENAANSSYCSDVLPLRTRNFHVHLFRDGLGGFRATLHSSASGQGSFSSFFNISPRGAVTNFRLSSGGVPAILAENNSPSAAPGVDDDAKKNASLGSAPQVVAIFAEVLNEKPPGGKTKEKTGAKDAPPIPATPGPLTTLDPTPRVKPRAMEIIQRNIPNPSAEHAGYCSGNVTIERNTYHCDINPRKEGGYSVIVIGKIREQRFQLSLTLSRTGQISDYRCRGSVSGNSVDLVLDDEGNLIPALGSTAEEKRQNSRTRMAGMIDRLEQLIGSRPTSR